MKHRDARFRARQAAVRGASAVRRSPDLGTPRSGIVPGRRYRRQTWSAATAHSVPWPAPARHRYRSRYPTAGAVRRQFLGDPGDHPATAAHGPHQSGRNAAPPDRNCPRRPMPASCRGPTPAPRSRSRVPSRRGACHSSPTATAASTITIRIVISIMVAAICPDRWSRYRSCPR